MPKPPTVEQLRDVLCDLFREGHELVVFLTADPRLRGLLYERLGGADEQGSEVLSVSGRVLCDSGAW